MPTTRSAIRQALILLFALASAAFASTTTKDVEYGRAGDAKLLLDATVPDGNGPFPVVVYVHGGGWSSGDRRTDTAVLEPLSRVGVVCLSIEYRLAPADRWPACLDDVRTAVRWAKANAAKFKGDPARVALVGYSAGGQLACLAAMTADKETAVQAVVAIAPPTDFELDLPQRGGLSKSLQDLLNRPKQPDAEAITQLREIGPLRHIRPGLPPTLILHGTADKSVPYAGSQTFQSEMKKAGNACDLVTLPNAPHRVGEWEKFDAVFGKTMTDWLLARLAPGT